jgi:hypothetical protein
MAWVEAGGGSLGVGVGRQAVAGLERGGDENAEQEWVPE